MIFLLEAGVLSQNNIKECLNDNIHYEICEKYDILVLHCLILK